MELELRLSSDEASLLLLDALRLGIPQEHVEPTLLLANEAYRMGRDHRRNGNRKFEERTHDETDLLAIKHLGDAHLKHLTDNARQRYNMPPNMLSVVLKIADSAFLLGYADEVMGIPDRASKFTFDSEALKKIANTYRNAPKN